MIQQLELQNSHEADACIERYGLKTVRYEAQVKHPHTPVRTWKHRAIITACMTQNKCGMLEGVILHTMPSQRRVHWTWERPSKGRHVPRQNVISRMVTVIQYRIEAQYVPIAEANRMKTTHVAGTPLRGRGRV